MSQEQPAYYSPAPAQGEAPVPGTPQYQYVTPQPLDPSQQQQYVSPQPLDPSQQQQYAQYQQPETVLQQPYYPAQSPAPVYQQPTEYKEQPAAVYAEAHPAQPVVISFSRGDGHGLTGRIHNVQTCCGCFPLHTGAMIITILMVIFYLYCGIVLLTSGTFSGAYNAVLLVLGVVYLGVAGVSIMGFIGAYKQDPKLVTKFVTFFVIGSIVWAVLEIIEMAIQVSAYSNLCGYYYYACGFNWAVWIVIFLLGLGFQYYFACCLVSYQRDLLAKLNGDVDGNRAVEMV